MLVENENKYYHAANNRYFQLWRAAPTSINPEDIKSNTVSLLSLLNKDTAAQRGGSDPN